MDLNNYVKRSSSESHGSEGQLTDTLMMIRPSRFGFNEETSVSNPFQKHIDRLSAEQIREIARLEFNNFVNTVRAKDINVVVFDDTEQPKKPDAVFPDWLSTHANGTLFTYPLLANMRLSEIRGDVLDKLVQQFGYKIDRSLEKYRDRNAFMEGVPTGVMDHVNKVAYASISPRCHPMVLKKWSEKMGVDIEMFRAFGSHGEAMYHTDVILTIADEFVLVGMETIHRDDRERVLRRLAKDRTIIPLSNRQIYTSFAGNVQPIRNSKGQKFLIMSTRAYKSYTGDQMQIICGKYGYEIIPVPINLIETIGGGSAHCMCREIFKPKSST